MDETARSDLLDADAAAAVLGVDRSRIDVLVADGLLTVASEAAGQPLFQRAEVEAVRLAGA
ncbi:MAG TPA: hypothetical protein VFU19_18880 [Iamia sp.]|nr:hypothetical protein [Iamia sp.]